MLAACACCPARSSSKPWPIACAGSARAVASSSTTPRLGLRRIQSAEVVEHHPPLLRRELPQLVPGGIAEPGPGAGGPGLQRGRHMDTVARSRPAHALLVLVGLVVREGAPGVQQTMIQALLPLDRLAIEPSRFELARELLRFVRERT